MGRVDESPATDLVIFCLNLCDLHSICLNRLTQEPKHPDIFPCSVDRVGKHLAFLFCLALRLIFLKIRACATCTTAMRAQMSQAHSRLSVASRLSDAECPRPWSSRWLSGPSSVPAWVSEATIALMQGRRSHYPQQITTRPSAGHIKMDPLDVGPAGGSQRFNMFVTHGCDGAPTAKLEVEIPTMYVDVSMLLVALCYFSACVRYPTCFLSYPN